MSEKMNKILMDAKTCKPTLEQTDMIEFLIAELEDKEQLDTDEAICIAYLAGLAAAGTQLDLTSGD